MVKVYYNIILVSDIFTRRNDFVWKKIKHRSLVMD